MSFAAACYVLEIAALALLVWSAVLASRIVWLANEAPPRHTNPNATEYFSEANFPLIADRELGVWNRPSHHFVKHTDIAGGGRLTTEVWFDHYGVRVAGPGMQTPDQVDVLVVGESNTWGQGTPYEKTYAAIIGERLGMSVANLGLIASSGVQDLILVRRFIHRRPKYVVYGFWEEHFASNVTRCPSIDSPVCLGRPIVKGQAPGQFRVSLPIAAEFTLKDYRRWYLESAPDGAHSIWNDWYWTARILGREWLESRFLAMRRESGPWRRLAATRDWPRVLGATKFVLTEMQQLADSVGARLIVPYMPFYFEEDVLPPPPELAIFARERGILLVSMHSLWAARKRDGSAFIYEGEGHLNDQGHEDVAAEILRALTASGYRTSALAATATHT